VVGKQSETSLGRKHVAPQVIEEIAGLDGNAKTPPGAQMECVEVGRQVFRRIRTAQRQPGTLCLSDVSLNL
jgi:hypothetical protein